jgi:hypothetical protein
MASGLIDSMQIDDPEIRRLLEEDVPPKRKGRPPGSKNRTTTQTPSGKTVLSGKALELKLEETFTVVGVAVSMRNEADGKAIIKGAHELSGALCEMAQTVPWLMRTLQMLASGASSARLINAVAAIAIPIGVNHGRVPTKVGEMFGMVPGDVVDTTATDTGEPDSVRAVKFA